MKDYKTFNGLQGEVVSQPLFNINM